MLTSVELQDDLDCNVLSLEEVEEVVSTSVELEKFF